MNEHTLEQVIVDFWEHKFDVLVSTTIIESTARKVGSYSYQSVSGRPHGTWHEEVGYGLIDAGVSWDEWAPGARLDLPLLGKTYVITGTLPSLSREQAQAMLEEAGAKVELK